MINSIIFSLLFISQILSNFNCLSYEYAEPTIDLPGLGSIKGHTIQTAWTFRNVYQFVDVKYAEAPSGKNRFKPPIPVKSWKTMQDKTHDGIGCPSVFHLADTELHTKTTKDIEDCLSLTITSPNINGSYPVLVYIHGEFLFEGNNLEGSPEYFLEKDVVLVTPQYRLGPFGFLSTKTEAIPGNAGVLDVILAMHWIKHFISFFGGDPSRITIMGQVGGAAIAHLLTYSPVVEKGLFQQAIYHSGSSFMPVFLSNNSKIHAIDIAEKSGCNHTDIEDINKCLIELPVLDLLKGFVEHVKAHAHEGLGETGGIQFTIGGPSPVLPNHPMELYYEDVNFSIPTMGGCPKNAGTRMLKEIFENDFENKIPDLKYKANDYIQHIIFQGQGFDFNGVLTQFAKKEFFTSASLKNGTFKAMLPGLIDLAGTIVHKIPVLTALNRNAMHLPQKTFLYSFDYKGQYNRYPDFDEDFDLHTPFTAGVTLTDENQYLFPYPDHVQDLNVLDKEMARKMIELWTSFVINGVPNVDEKDFLWPPMTEPSGPYLKIDHTFSIGNDFNNEFKATLKDETEGSSLVRQNYFYIDTEALLKYKWKKKL